MKSESCCEQPALIEAYVWFWPFRAVYCQCCGDVALTVGWLLEQVWSLLVWPFWDGQVWINRTKQVEPAAPVARGDGKGE